MLHKNPELILPATYTLIQELQTLDELKEFYLVGGTALTLQLGHRNSVDIDLFTQQEFNSQELLDMLKEKYTIEIIYRGKNSIITIINRIKVDFIRHNYAYINPPITEEAITFLSMKDIAALKLNAITQSGKRLKDFIDAYYLLQHFSLDIMLGFFAIKYPQTNPLIPLKAINYFDDIDENIDPPKMLKPLPLAEIKNRIQDATLNPHKIY